MNISKALVLAVQNWDQYGRFYDAIKEDQDLAKPGLTEEEIEKSKLLVGFVNERLRDMLVTPLRTLRDTLKPKAHKVGIENDRAISWNDCWADVWWYPLKSNKNCCYLRLELSQEKKEGGDLVIEVSISFEGLGVIETFSSERQKIEARMVKMLGSDWVTSKDYPIEYISQCRDCGFDREEMLEEYAEDGGRVYYKRLVSITGSNTVEGIRDTLVDIGTRYFVDKMTEFKEFEKEFIQKL